MVLIRNLVGHLQLNIFFLQLQGVSKDSIKAMGISKTVSKTFLISISINKLLTILYIIYLQKNIFVNHFYDFI